MAVKEIWFIFINLAGHIVAAILNFLNLNEEENAFGNIWSHLICTKKAKFAGLCNWNKRKRNTLRRSLKINQIHLKIITQGFLGSLITDLHSDLKNSKLINFYKPRPPYWIRHFEFFKSGWKWKCLRKDLEPVNKFL